MDKEEIPEKIFEMEKKEEIKKKLFTKFLTDFSIFS